MTKYSYVSFHSVVDEYSILNLCYWSGGAYKFDGYGILAPQSGFDVTEVDGKYGNATAL